MAPTIQAQFAGDVIRRVEPGAARSATRAVQQLVEAAPALNGSRELMLLHGLADRAVRVWAAAALSAVGDTVRANLAAKMSILDGDSAAVAAFNLREYAAGIDDLPPQPGPGAAQQRDAAKVVLERTCELLDMLGERELVFDHIEPAERDVACRNAAAALVAAWDGGVVHNLPDELRSTLTSLGYGTALKLPV